MVHFFRSTELTRTTRLSLDQLVKVTSHELTYMGIIGPPLIFCHFSAFFCFVFGLYWNGQMFWTAFLKRIVSQVDRGGNGSTMYLG